MRRVVNLENHASSSSSSTTSSNLIFPGRNTPPAIIATSIFDYLVFCRHLKTVAMHPFELNCVLLSVVMVNRHLRCAA